LLLIRVITAAAATRILEAARWDYNQVFKCAEFYCCLVCWHASARFIFWGGIPLEDFILLIIAVSADIDEQRCRLCETCEVVAQRFAKDGKPLRLSVVACWFIMVDAEFI
jgi:hypothetical protein